jgi:hypothetical protein
MQEATMEEEREAPRKPSRQFLRAQARQKRDAEGWIAALRVTDPQMRRAIRSALGTRHVTRVDLESAIGVSLEAQTPGEDRG